MEVLPYKDLMGTCGQPGYVFREFCLKQGIFSWTKNSLRDSVDQAVNSFVITNGLNKKSFNIYYCLTQGMVSG